MPKRWCQNRRPNRRMAHWIRPLTESCYPGKGGSSIAPSYWRTLSTRRL